MQLKHTLLAASLSACATSSFVIISIPTPAIDIFNIQSQISSLQSQISGRIASLTASLPTSALSRAASAQTALVQFVATAPSSLNIPPEVTAAGIERYTTTPAWYTALPSDLRAYFDENNRSVQSVVDEVVKGSATASRTSAGTTSTGLAVSDKVSGYFGLGAAAVAGVFVM